MRVWGDEVDALLISPRLSPPWPKGDYKVQEGCMMEDPKDQRITVVCLNCKLETGVTHREVQEGVYHCPKCGGDQFQSLPRKEIITK
jgi:hypothetical protein